MRLPKIGLQGICTDPTLISEKGRQSPICFGCVTIYLMVADSWFKGDFDKPESEDWSESCIEHKKLYWDSKT